MQSNASATLRILSSLEKVFPDSCYTEKQETVCFSMLKNEKKSFQLAFSANEKDRIQIKIESALSDYIKPYYVNLVPCALAAPKNADDYFISKEPGLYPDLLAPIENDAFTVKSDGANSIWFEIKGDEELPVGVFAVELTIVLGENTEKASVTIEVIDALLPKQTLIYTNWFHTDSLMSYYGIEVFSDEYWRVVKNFLQRAKDYGMNCVLTPLFTPPLDTQVGKERPTVQLVKVKKVAENKYEFNFDLLDKWIDMCAECGIEYYEMSHLFTQWGAKHAPKIVAEVNGKEEKIFGWKTKATGAVYKNFLKQFSACFSEYATRRGIKEKCFIHVSDEPAFSMLWHYKKASKIIHKLFPDYKVIDAMSSYPLSKLCKMALPIPANNMIEPFIGKVDELWTYYCCCQANKNVSNRFFSMPSLRNRILGWQMYKLNIKGFLHWGYNFYFSQYAKRPVNPYEETDAGKAFSSGDSFIVYPGENGMPLNSLRLNVFYDGLQDMMAMQLLESKIGKEAVIKLIEENAGVPISISEYPHKEEWLLEAREKINHAIQSNL